MVMLIRIAWRNIWRHKTRSFVVMGAISLGIWSLIFLLSFSRGLIYNLIDNSIRREIGHVQVEHESYRQKREIGYLVEESARKVALLAADPAVEAVTRRLLVSGMVSSARGARGVQIWGVEPGEEGRVSFIREKIKEGDFLPEGHTPTLLISGRLATRLGIRMKSKVVLTFQDLDGHITAGAFRVAGLFDSGTTPFDEGTVMVRRDDLLALTGGVERDPAHQLVAVVVHPDSAATVRDRLTAVMAGDKVTTYREVAPEIALYESQIGMSNMIMITIFMLALIFGIINTMLMAVLERVRELGMLMAIGMNRRKVFLMVVLETLFLGLTAMPAGLILVEVSLAFFGQTGIDLRIFSEGMREYGMSEVVYPDPATDIYLRVTLSVVATAFLGALYPAWKAVRLKPVDALTKI